MSCGRQRRKAIDKYKAKLKELEKKEEDLNKKKKACLKGREQTESRTALLAKLAELKKMRDTLQKQLDEYAENDPELIEKIAGASKVRQFGSFLECCFNFLKKKMYFLKKKLVLF